MTVQFIELTDTGGYASEYDAARKFAVNAARIVSAYPLPGWTERDGSVVPAHTILTLTDGPTYRVAETPDEIAALCGIAVQRPPEARETPAPPEDEPFDPEPRQRAVRVRVEPAIRWQDFDEPPRKGQPR